MKFASKEGWKFFKSLAEAEAFMDKKQHQTGAFGNEVIAYENGNVELKLKNKAGKVIYALKHVAEPLTASEMDLITQKDLS